jgi:hypothetical protein
MGKIGEYIPYALHQIGGALCDIVGVIGLEHKAPGAPLALCVGALLQYSGLPHYIKEKISDKISSVYERLAHSESRGESMRGAYKGAKILRNILVIFDAGIAAMGAMEAMEGNTAGAMSAVIFEAGTIASTIACQIETNYATKKLEELCKKRGEL